MDVEKQIETVRSQPVPNSSNREFYEDLEKQSATENETAEDLGGSV
jgi:hypothetical protein